MFKLIGTVCILAINNGQFDLCFNSGFTGAEYKTLKECEDVGTKVVELIEQDLVSRNLKVVMTCKPPQSQGASYVVISN